jgi:DNA-binding winged helix-turn-helix (wHTH) protein/Flp pilus assembly protein TadD
VRRFLFDRFELDERAGQLREAGELVPLQPKPYELLVLLLERPGRLFSREELQERLWPGVHVTDDSLSQAMARLRKVLGEGLLETKRGRGYRLLVEVRTAAPGEAPRPRRTTRGLFGREHELRLIAQGLAQTGMVWLSGPPGAGKTALALASAASHPALTVPVPPGGALALALCQALGLPATAEPGQALGARGELLVVVDDAQHDPDASTLLEQWRQQAPEIVWLITSRERGSLGQSVALGPLGLQPAVCLLAERAGVALDEQDPAVAELVTKLDGNPLALCLAAPRLRLLQPAELLSRLSARFELLRDAGRSLSAALGSAWAALDETARDDLRVLAALGFEVPMELGEALLGEGALDRLQRLVDASWVEVYPQDGGTVAGLAHSAHAWIEAQTGEPARHEAVRRAGLWLEEHAPPRALAYRRGDQEASAWLVRMAQALYRAAMAVPPDRSPDLLVRSALLAQDRRGGRSEELEALVRRSLAHPALRPAEQAGLCLRLGMMIGRRDPDASIPALREAVELAERHGDPNLRSWAWAELAYTMSETDPPSATAVAERALELARQGADPEYLAYARYVRCAVVRANGQPDLAGIEEVLAMPGLESTDTHAVALVHHAVLLEELGQLAEAEVACRRLLARAPKQRRPALQGQLAGVLQQRGELEEACELYTEALEGCRWFGQTHREQIFVMQRARVRVARGQLEEAERELADLLSVAQTDRQRGGALCISGLLALRQGRPALALHHLQASHTCDPTDVQILSFLAVVAAGSGDLVQAERWLAQAADLPWQGQDEPTYELARAWILQGRAAQDPADRHAYELQLQLLDRVPAPGVAPWSQRLVEMTWLRPPL